MRAVADVGEEDDVALDLGELGERVSSAQITSYTPDELLGSTVMCVVNFPPRRIGPFESEVLVLGAMDPEKGVVLLEPDSEVELGARIA